jgi:hypothetical protein
MNINNLLSSCNIDVPYHVYTTNDIIISQAPYIDNCEELETLFYVNNNEGIVDDLQNQNLPFLHEHFKSNSNSDVFDNVLFGILVILAIFMFIVVLPEGF